MGKIRVIKSSELGGTSDEPIYPVTSIKAIYDLNNTQLSTILEEQEDKIQKNFDTANRAETLGIQINAAFGIFKNGVEDSYKDINSKIDSTKTAINNITADINSLKGGEYVVAYVSPLESQTRATSDSKTNIKYCPVIYDGTCEENTDTVEGLLNDLKDGQFIVPKEPGEYKINNQTLTVKDYGLIQKQGDSFVVISFGIPMPTFSKGDNAKMLAINEDGIQWL